jgi:hypothetical protein
MFLTLLPLSKTMAKLFCLRKSRFICGLVNRLLSRVGSAYLLQQVGCCFLMACVCT